ncbi:MAG TPA: hypothetical protein VE967_11100 [Gemmatimonadaceae bacterium]|nr:hypothetical protein [Gemmatimonadaceae bacterium]
MTSNSGSSFNCDAFDALLPDLVEDNVVEGARRAAEAHAAGCARCRSLLADLTEIRADAARLPVLKPSRDLWDGISARIETPAIDFQQHGARQQRVRWQMAAAAVALVTVTASATWMIARQASESRTVPETALASNSAPADTSPFRLVAAYDDEISALRKRLADRPGGIDSATNALITQNFRVIDEAIARVRIALDSAPSNALLEHQLRRAYDAKLNTLRQIAALQTD